MGSSWNPAHALKQVRAAHGAVAPSITGDTLKLTARAEHFADAVRFAVEQPDAMRRLHRLTARLCDGSTVDALLPRVLEAALMLSGADFGDVQLVDPATGALLLTTEAGFDDEFLEYFAVVDDTGSVCGRAAGAGQVAIFDVNADPGFAPHRDIAAAAGFRGVQSTPLLDYSGRVVAVVSTHFQNPWRPSEQQLRLLQLYCDFAGEAIARSMGANGTGFDPIGRAMVSALLAPDQMRLLGASTLADDGPGGDDAERPARWSFDPARDLTGAEAAFAASSDRLVRHLFGVGLQLHTLAAVFDQAAATPENIRAAGDAVAGVLEDLDMLTRDAGLAMLALVRDRATERSATRAGARPRR
ncbi:GAF domain-containing protein [Nocardia yunnanensis]|uniref:GAF domain-containing protein n=1 Tax=Nocardia yunnanensis TaxID=2382165 RepID=A0A386ZBE2_9NOCA|nr:GAF domain-containing protein [Nocardia yunnanensis]AYF74898.1 GAF domain-containing protein [Nocardia yunnanensis]